MLGLGVGVGVIDEAGKGRLAGTDETDIEEGEVFLGLDGMPLDVAKGEARLDDAIRQGHDAYIESAAMVDAEVKAAGEKMRGLHEEGAAGETGIAVEAGGDTVALHQPCGEDLRVGGIGHGCSSGVAGRSCGPALLGIHSSARNSAFGVGRGRCMAFVVQRIGSPLVFWA